MPRNRADWQRPFYGPGGRGVPPPNQEGRRLYPSPSIEVVRRSQQAVYDMTEFEQSVQEARQQITDTFSLSAGLTDPVSTFEAREAEIRQQENRVRARAEETRRAQVDRNHPHNRYVDPWPRVLDAPIGHETDRTLPRWLQYAFEESSSRTAQMRTYTYLDVHELYQSINFLSDLEAGAVYNHLISLIPETLWFRYNFPAYERVGQNLADWLAHNGRYLTASHVLSVSEGNLNRPPLRDQRQAPPIWRDLPTERRYSSSPLRGLLANVDFTMMEERILASVSDDIARRAAIDIENWMFGVDLGRTPDMTAINNRAGPAPAPTAKVTQTKKRGYAFVMLTPSVRTVHGEVVARATTRHHDGTETHELVISGAKCTYQPQEKATNERATDPREPDANPQRFRDAGRRLRKALHNPDEHTGTP